MLLIRMFRLRSFGVGTMLTKVDIVMTASSARCLFRRADPLGAVALLVVLAGVVAMSLGARTPAALAAGTTISWSPTCGPPPCPSRSACALSFTVSYLTFSEATLVISATAAFCGAAPGR